VENLGVSLGYTGFIMVSDGADVENPMFNGIDLRATWTGIEGLSLSTHNNISFANGVEKDWTGMLGKDSSFLTLYNAIGATKEIMEKFSVNAEISNVFSKTDNGGAGKLEYDSLGVAAKFIAKVSENAEFDAGLRLDIEKTTGSGVYGDPTGEDIDDLVTTFSIPIGIIVSF
jgi:outer membrane receptor protein involved in Fe transport